MTAKNLSDPQVQGFYDSYWPANVPDYERTSNHVLSLLPEKRPFGHTLDAGCGTGVCSLALAGQAERVTAVDASFGSLATAQDLARNHKVENIRFQQADLLALPFADGEFDLVWSWGVIHHTVAPRQAFSELVRVLAPSGYLILAVYLRTALTPIHETIRNRCLRMNEARKQRFLNRVAKTTDIFSTITGKRPQRDDNPLTTSKIEDWYFVPEKHFFSIPEIRRMFSDANLEFELLSPRTGRFKSTSNFIVRGKKLP